MSDQELIEEARNRANVFREMGWASAGYLLDSIADRIENLTKAIRNHRDQKGDNRCWLDDQELYGVLGGEADYDSSLPSRSEFLESCARFWEQRQNPIDTGEVNFGQPCPKSMTIAQLQAEVERLRAELDMARKLLLDKSEVSR